MSRKDVSSYGEYKRLPNGEFIETIDKVNEELSQDINR